MELLTLLLALAQVPTSASVETRVIDSRGTPVTLVGLPCGEERKKVRTEESPATPEAKAYMESKVFACERECLVGIRFNDGVRIASFVISTAMAHDRGRVTGTTSPVLTPAVLSSCNGESYVVASMAKIAWPTFAGVVYVSDVTFQDGASWHADRDAIEKDALKAWIVQPKRGQ